MRELPRFTLGELMALVLLLLAGSFLYFYRLDKTDIDARTPAKIAVYARQMNLQPQNAWLAPILRGKPRVDVPPLYLWCVRLASGFSDEVDAYDVRFPGSLSALLIALLAAWWLYRHILRYGREDIADAPPEGLALLAGLLVACNPLLFDIGREGSLHSMFTLVYIAAAFCWGESLEARRSFYAGRPWRSWILWGYALAGLAMLIRGPLVLPLLWVPYLLAVGSYRLRRPDRVHLQGLLLIILIGGIWPILVSYYHPKEAQVLWNNWLTFRLGAQIDKPVAFDEYLRRLVLGTFPWVLLAIIMAIRVWLKKDRSPTLVFWTCSLVGNLAVLTFFSFHVGQHLLPVMIFILLLAADALYRWHYENAWARVWRIVLRIFLIFAIVAGIVTSALLNSDSGLAIFILVPVAWLGWVIYARVYSLEFTPWETTIRLAAMIILLIVAVEGVLLTDYEPRRRFIEERLTYFERIQRRLPKRDRILLQYRSGMNILYDYYLGELPAVPGDINRLRVPQNLMVYIFADRDIAQLTANPRLVPETFLWDGHQLPVEGMFRLLPDTPPTSGTLAARIVAQAPLRVALLGNAGTRTGDQREVAQEIVRAGRGDPIDNILLLGNNIYGGTVFDHLAFIRSFERPYQKLLRQGTLFHAALGHEDQSYAWLQTHYPPFHMDEKRYYNQVLDGGLVECFMLDSETLYDRKSKAIDRGQLAWLNMSLARSRAPWKIVGLYRPLVGTSKSLEESEPLARVLLPIFDRHRVNMVACSGGQFYARYSLPGHFPLFLNCGWSGDVSKKAERAIDPQAQKVFSRTAGFVLADCFADRIVLQAINEQSEMVDQITLTNPTPPAAAGPQPANVQSQPVPTPGAASEATTTTMQTTTTPVR